jgi:hypothetical protein
MERFCFVVVLAFLLSPVVGHSQTRILVSCRCETGGERLSGLVERSALLSLGQAGFVAVGADPASKDPSWTLEADVSYRSGNYRLELSFLSPEGSRLSSAVMSGRLSLDFDVNLMEAVERVVRDSGVDFAPTRPTEAERGLASSGPALPAMREKQEVADLLAIMVDEAPPPSALMAPGAVLLPEPDEAARAAPPLTPTGPVVAGAIMPEPAADEAPAMVSDNASPAVAASAGPAPPAVLSLPGENGPAAVVLSAGARPRGPLVIDADSGPVFVVGKASDTFRYGFDVSCRIGAAFDFGILRLDAALRTGYARLSPTGLVGGALHLVTLGPELGLVLPGSAPLRFRCRLSFGPLYVAAEASGSEVVGKILPFGSAGLGLDVLPAPRFSIGLELELMVVFERNEPLIALVPVLGLGLRF